jgi:DNA-binding transcriptional LysR family regulator
MSARPFEWSDLEIFLAVARSGTLAAAAATLLVDGSTVQRRVGKLERSLRTRLFDRSQRGYSLTAAGEELLAHAQQMEREALAAQRKLVARDDSLEGTVRVATVDDLAFAVLSPIVRSFRDQNPRVTIEMDIRSTLADLARRQADVAIRFGGVGPEFDVIEKKVSRIGVALYASRRYLKAHGHPMRLEELAGHAIVRGDEQTSGLAMEKLIDRYADPGKIAFRSNSFLARLAAIRDGVGLGFLGCFMGERERGVERLPFRFPEAAGWLRMLIHVDLRRNARVRAFVEHAHAAMAALRSSFEAPE